MVGKLNLTIQDCFHEQAHFPNTVSQILIRIGAKIGSGHRYFQERGQDFEIPCLTLSLHHVFWASS